MLKDFAEFLQKQRRAVHETTTICGRYTEKSLPVIYSDAEGCYINNQKTVHRSISSIKSLIQVVKSEAERQENETGKYFTVIFNQKGGLFVPDDDFLTDVFTFERALSQQWLTLQNQVNKEINHIQLLTLLQKLKPSIQDYTNIFMAYQKVRVIGQSEMTSNPVFDDSGEAEEGFKVKYRLQGGGKEETANLPLGFKLSLPYSKASDKKYEFEVQFLISINPQTNKFMATVICPVFEIIEEKAIFDEVEEFKEQVKDIKEILILEDY